ncbi:MAG: hypothetical protein JRC86_13450 [Deltaproteobacteria bacterium]|nr:hypothetical protein [Deltaproteobacteria bacterium]
MAVTMRFDLRDDVPSDIGHVFAGKTVKKIYSQKHVPRILDCLAEKMRSAKLTTRQEKFDVFLYGYAPEQILMMMASNISIVRRSVKRNEFERR